MTTDHLPTPGGMNRRHFLQHLATAAAVAPTVQFVSHLQANAAEVKASGKACILMWMGGGPPTIDLWDLKPGSKNGGEFRPISTSGDYQIGELLPETAKVGDELAIIRSMSTREADHGRGQYFMHTGFVPNPTVVHPTFGSVVSHELAPAREKAGLEIPAFVSIGGGGGSPGFLGMSHAPFVVGGNGQIRNAQAPGMNGRGGRGGNQSAWQQRLGNRLQMLNVLEEGYIKENRGEGPAGHRDVYGKAVSLMTSQQMRAFRTEEEPEAVREAYGQDQFGRGLLMARRLVETGVPFVEVNLGGWDMHNGVFASLRNKVPAMDKAIAALVTDLKSRGMLDDVVLVWMGEFGRTPRINQNVGRDHWAQSWSVMMGGGGLNTGQAVGATDKDGTSVEGTAYLPGDVWATAAKALGIPLETVHTSKRGRPMKLANGGTPIKELVG